jgi:nicotinamidase-related amidase
MPSSPQRQLSLVIDMLSDYAFPDAERLADAAVSVVAGIGRARDAADRSNVPVAYANDLHDQWDCSPEQICARALQGHRPDLVRPLLPRPGDAFLRKGQHSAFYGTPLAHLLHEKEITDVVLCGQVTEQCVLYTALDTHVRHYGITVLDDAVLSLDHDLGAAALHVMEQNMGAQILSTIEWDGVPAKSDGHASLSSFAPRL